MGGVGGFLGIVLGLLVLLFIAPGLLIMAPFVKRDRSSIPVEIAAASIAFWAVVGIAFF
jgi:ABC-type lipoprotein release transport system permease subunit